MIAAVFDAMVLLQAATNDRGPAFACIELAGANLVTLHVSPVTLAELQDVLSRPGIRAKFRTLTQQRVDTFLQKLSVAATVTSAVPDAGFPVRDVDDLPYLH
jgi:predicted nucleic acid-binding protein